MIYIIYGYIRQHSVDVIIRYNPRPIDTSVTAITVGIFGVIKQTSLVALIGSSLLRLQAIRGQ